LYRAGRKNPLVEKKLNYYWYIYQIVKKKRKPEYSPAERSFIGRD